MLYILPIDGLEVFAFLEDQCMRAGLKSRPKPRAEPAPERRPLKPLIAFGTKLVRHGNRIAAFGADHRFAQVHACYLIPPTTPRQYGSREGSLENIEHRMAKVSDAINGSTYLETHRQRVDWMEECIYEGREYVVTLNQATNAFPNIRTNPDDD